MTRKLLRKRLLGLTVIVALTVVLSCSWSGQVFAGSNGAEGDRVGALEARIGELEALVHQLIRNQAVTEQRVEAVAVESVAADVVEARVIKVVEEERLVEQEQARKHSYKFGGYVKADVIHSDYSSGPVASGSAGRDFYLPGTIPVGPDSADGESYLDFSAKESRLNFKTDHILDNGARLGAFIEMDFLLSGHGDERISNSYNPRLRHAFVTYNNWLFGQTWTTLFNVGALPDNVDFIGPAESTIFGRQAMIRYSNGPWQFAVENPETTVTPFGEGDGRIVADDNQAPDGIIRYNLKGDWASFTAAGIIRQLAYQDNASGIDDKTTGYGVSLSGKFYIGDKDDLRWMASAGKGLGRYIGLNTSNGAVLDADGNLHAIDVLGIFGSYRHFWNDQWRSNLTLGYLSVDNEVRLTGPEATKNASSFHINLIYSPQAKLEFGVEFMYADRELENGDDGDLKRFQVSAKYAY